MDLLVTGGLVVAPEGPRHCDVLVEGGAITEIGAPLRATTSAEVVDAAGCIVLPGGVDPHCHLVKDIPAASRAAALGGTTTALSFTLPEAGEPPATAVRRAHDMAADGGSLIDLGFHASCYRPNALTAKDVADAASAGADAIKIFMAYDELGIMASGAGLFRAMSYAASCGLPVQVHCEDGEVIEALVEQAGEAGRRGARAFAASRPPVTEELSVERTLAVASLTGARCYLPHLSTAGALARVRAHRSGPDARRAPVAAEVCLHHALVDDSEYDGARAGDFLVAPPLRPAGHLVAVRAALSDGTVDAVGSDHSQDRTPVDARIAAGPDAAYGIAGIGARLPLLLSWGRQHGIALERLCHLLAAGPARAFGYAPRKGVLAPGSDGDIVVWDPEVTWTVQEASFPDGTATAPYAGRSVTGAVRFVSCRGRPLVRDGSLVGGEPAGSVLRPTGAP